MNTHFAPRCLFGVLQKALKSQKSIPSISNHFCVSRSQSNSTSYKSPLPDMYYNEDQKMMMETVAKIIETDINPNVDEWEAKEAFPAHTVFKKLGDAGMLGIDKSPDYGGLGLDYKYVAAVLEELGSMRCAGLALAVWVQTSMTQLALYKHGSEELKKQFLIPTIAGDVVAAITVSEPGGGSDVANIKTNAVRKGDDLIINGSKMWITNSFQADWTCMLANTSQGDKHKNKSLICVPMDSKGITKQMIHKIGHNCSDTGLLFFEDVRVPAKNIIGKEGMGFIYQMHQFQEERMGGTIGTLRFIDLALSETIDYTRDRMAFGKSILDNQYVYFQLGELITEHESLRALCYKCVDMFVAGHDVTMLASMIKLKIGRLSRKVGDTCLQWWGGMGYTREVFISRFYRDGRLNSIGGGCDEVMLEIIAKLLNISPDSKKKK